jgi:hypothetical protein
MVRFLRDSRVATFLGEFGIEVGKPVLELVKALATDRPELRAGEWVEGLRSASLSVQFLKKVEGQPDEAVLLVVDLASPEQSAALQAGFLAMADSHEPLASALAGSERFVSGGDPGWCVSVGSRFVIGDEGLRVEDYVALSAKQRPALSGAEYLQKALAALSKSEGTSVMWFALGRSLQEILTAQGGSQSFGFLARLPGDLNPLASPRVARMQFTGQRFLTEMQTLEPAPATKPQAVDPAWLQLVPTTAMIAYSSSFEGASSAQRLRELLSENEQGKAALASLETKLGHGPEKIFARLGPRLTVHAGALNGPALPETFAWLDCDDAAAFAAEFEALVGALGETLPGYVAKTKPYKVKKEGSDEKVEVPITTLTLPPNLIPIPMISVSPSFAPVGSKLLFALNSMDLKGELKRVLGEAPAGSHDGPIAALKLPADAESVFVMDWARLFAGLTPTIKAVAGMAELPFDVNKLPPPEIYGEFFQPTFHFAVRNADGLRRRHEASFGPETWAGLMAAGFGASRRFQQGMPTAPSASQPVGTGGQ